MYKKTLLSLAVASSMTLTGCIGGTESGDDESAGNNPNAAGLTWPIFNPAAGTLPIPSDLNFDSEQGDGTFGVPDSSPPVTTALNELSGNSTVAPAVIQTNGQLDASTVIYGQSVFLIELAYPSGSPVQGLSAQEAPSPVGLAVARADVESLSGADAIRIVPIDPLKPNTRYIAVVTNDVLDVNGDPIVQSPTYEFLTADEGEPVPDALAAVQGLINGLWEPVGVGFVNAVRAMAEAPPLDASNVALSYSFTTSNDEQVLKYIAEPATWFADQLTTFVRLGASTQVGGDFDDRNDAANAAIDGFPQSLDLPDDSPLNALFAPEGTETPEGPCAGDTGEAAISCVGISLASSVVSALPTPIAGFNRTSEDIEFTGAPMAIGSVSAVAGNVLTSNPSEPSPEAVLVSEGTVSLPTYMGTTASGALTQSWVADAALAAGLNENVFGALGVTLPQADPDTSTAVNSVFPFPKQRGTVDVPLLTIYPGDGDAKGIVLFQHGITSDRSSALTIGTNLALNGYVVVAIDQPLHGVNPSSTTQRLELANQLLVGAGLEASTIEAFGLATALVEGADAFDEALDGTPVDGAIDGPTRASLVRTVANAGSSIPGLEPGTNPRHFNVFADSQNQVQPMVFDPASAAGTDGSGSFYINLQNFLNSRDNNRQSVLDQMNLRASLTDGNVVIPGPTPIEIQDDTPVFFAGHSLGTITGAPYVAAVNSNRISVTAFVPDPANPEGDPIPASSAANDISAASLLTPGGGIARLLENSPAFAPRIVGGLQGFGLGQNTASYEAFLNVNQATVDAADPVNFIDDLAGSSTPVLLSMVVGDQVIPNAADGDVFPENPPLSITIGNLMIDSFPAPLAGSLPLDVTGNDSIIREDYDSETYENVNHGSPVDPISSPDAFGQMSIRTNVFFDDNLPLVRR